MDCFNKITEDLPAPDDTIDEPTTLTQPQAPPEPPAEPYAPSKQQQNVFFSVCRLDSP